MTTLKEFLIPKVSVSLCFKSVFALIALPLINTQPNSGLTGVIESELKSFETTTFA